MKTRHFILLITALSFLVSIMACNKKEKEIESTQILMISVDFTTNELDLSKEISLAKHSETFTIKTIYDTISSNGDNITLYYKELDELLFHGSIPRDGSVGEIIYPKDWQKASDLEQVDTADYITPKEGFDCIFKDIIDEQYESDAKTPWVAVQPIVRVRSCLNKNPKVKLFLYTPCENNKYWKWIYIFKE